MEPSENDFYVSLMSNSSMEEFPSNTLSAFTNILARPFRLTENWVVGVTEVYFNSFETKQDYIEMAEVETFTPIISSSPKFKKKTKKRKREPLHDYKNLELIPERKKRTHNNNNLVIKAHSEYDILLTKKEMEDMCFDGRHANFARFLEVISNKVIWNVKSPVTFETMPSQTAEVSITTAKKEIKQRIFNVIRNTAWQALPEFNYTEKDNDYIFHIHLGDNKSQLVKISLMEHTSLESFIADVIQQLPRNQRNIQKLISLFDIFDYNTVKEDEISNDKSAVLRVEFSEYGVDAELNISQWLSSDKNLQSNGVTLSQLIKGFIDNIKTRNGKKLTLAEVYELRKLIKISALDVLRVNSLRMNYIDNSIKENSLQLKVAYAEEEDDYKLYTVSIEKRTYTRIEDFLNNIYQQIPLEFRNKKVFSSTLLQAFNLANTNNDRELLIYIPPQYEQAPRNGPLQPVGGNIYKWNTKVVDETNEESASHTESTEQNEENDETNEENTDENENVDESKDVPVDQNEDGEEKEDNTENVDQNEDGEESKDIVEEDTPENTDQTFSNESIETKNEKNSESSIVTNTNQEQSNVNKNTQIVEKTEPVVDNSPSVKIVSSPIKPKSSNEIPVNDDSNNFEFNFVNHLPRKKSSSAAATYIYIYCDIIRARLCTNQLTKALRIIPHIDKSAIRLEFNHVEYYPIERTNFDSISILLANGNAENIKFNASKCPTYVMLHFKRV